MSQDFLTDPMVFEEVVNFFTKGDLSKAEGITNLLYSSLLRGETDEKALYGGGSKKDRG